MVAPLLLLRVRFEIVPVPLIACEDVPLRVNKPVTVPLFEIEPTTDNPLVAAMVTPEATVKLPFTV